VSKHGIAHSLIYIIGYDGILVNRIIVWNICRWRWQQFGDFSCEAITYIYSKELISNNVQHG